MRTCSQCMHFSALVASDLIQQYFARMVTLADLCWLYVACDYWVWWLEGLLRILLLNVCIWYRRSASIWPDLLLTLTVGLSFLVQNNYSPLDNVAPNVILAIEFVSTFWSFDRRRQRKLWTHNASFRISRFTHRATRRSLLQPLLAGKRSADPPPQTGDKNASDPLISTFIDYEPHTSGPLAEKRILHVHVIHSEKVAGPVRIIFFHQFGSGSFTWQPVMEHLLKLRDPLTAQLVAVDRVAHGLTFATEPAKSGDSTPVSEDLSHTVGYTEVVNSVGFDALLTQQVVGRLDGASRSSGGNTHTVLVSCGGAGAAAAIEYYVHSCDTSQKMFENYSFVFLSPYNYGSLGVPSVLQSVANACVGRALLIAMAKSEITEVLPKLAWNPQPVPQPLMATYSHCFEQVPHREQEIVHLLKRVGRDERITDFFDKKNFAYPLAHLPTMVILGDQDRLGSVEEYTQFASLFHNAKTETIPDCGAAPQEQKPEQVATLIHKFITALVSSV